MSTHTGGVRVRQVAVFFWVCALGYLARARARCGPLDCGRSPQGLAGNGLTGKRSADCVLINVQLFVYFVCFIVYIA